MASVSAPPEQFQSNLLDSDLVLADFSYATTPGTFEDIVNLLVPELQRR